MTTAAVDYRAAHTLDARSLLALLPHLPQEDLREIRQAWAAFLANRRAPGQPYSSWQAAWNAFTGATPHQPGVITYTPSRCHTCHGRGFTTHNVARNLARTGHPAICDDCRGNRHGQRTRQPARYATVPLPGGPS